MAVGALGTVEPGKLADLVILNADPLKDIRNTQRIDSVVKNGELLSRSKLDEMLKKAKIDGAKRIPPKSPDEIESPDPIRY